MLHLRAALLPMLALTVLAAAIPSRATAQCTSCGAEDSHTPAAWPTDAEWVPISDNYRAAIQDPNDAASSYADMLFGSAPYDASALAYFDGTNVFLRFLLEANPRSGSSGDFRDYYWIMEVATAAGTHVATVGLNGAGNQTFKEHVYAVDPANGNLCNIYKESTSGASMARTVAAGSTGYYYLDLQLPLCYLAYVACMYNSTTITASTPLKFYFGTSSSHAQYIDYDFFSGSAVDFSTVGTARLDEIQTGSLPIELASFSVSKQSDGLLLRWSTTTEKNNYGFEIERSIDGAPWEPAGFVPGAGTSNEPHEYALLDTKYAGALPAGPVAYRLRQIDRDGGEHYSGTVEFTPAASPQLRLAQNYPNPFNPSTLVAFSLPVQRAVTLRVYDALGRVVATLLDHAPLAAGTHTARFDGRDLPSGSYLVRLESGGESSQRTMVLAR
jgi:hypothetical protein